MQAPRFYIPFQNGANFFELLTEDEGRSNAKKKVSFAHQHSTNFCSTPKRKPHSMDKEYHVISDKNAVQEETTPFEALQELLLEKERQQQKPLVADQHHDHDATQHEWPVNDDDDWSEPLELLTKPTKRRLTEFSTNRAVANELEKTRKRIRHSTGTVTTKPTAVKSSIVGTRPSHWKTVATIPPRRRSSSSSSNAPLSIVRYQQLTNAVTPSSFALPSQRPKPTDATTATTPQTSSFIPTFLENFRCNKDDDVGEWLTQDVNKVVPSASNKKPRVKGPLVQKLERLRNTINADMTRLQSGLFSSIQDPRARKHFMEIHIQSPMRRVNHPLWAAQATIVNLQPSETAWILFRERPAGQRLRLYNPVPLTMPSGKRVVICTQFHEVL
jgi:hypothetical protein